MTSGQQGLCGTLLIILPVSSEEEADDDDDEEKSPVGITGLKPIIPTHLPIHEVSPAV